MSLRRAPPMSLHCTASEPQPPAALVELMERGVRDSIRARRSRFESALAGWKKESEPEPTAEPVSSPGEIGP